MTMAELEALDRADRARLHAKAIDDVRRAIVLRREQHAPTDALERHLAGLTGRTA